MTHSFFAFLRFSLCLVLLTGCAPTPAPATRSAATARPTLVPTHTPSPAPSRTPRPSATPFPSDTPFPTLTHLPSLTPFPTLGADGPFLLALTGKEGATLSLYDQEGLGRRVLSLPDGCKIRNRALRDSVSPDGAWLVCYTGDLQSPQGLPLTLYLVSVADGTSRKVADVVGKDFREKLSRTSKAMRKLFPDSDGDVAVAFANGIYSTRWSPDARLLAFAGQMEGDSSDVYVYSLTGERVTRMEESAAPVGSLLWSPDGRYLVFENHVPKKASIVKSLYALRADGGLVQEPQVLHSDRYGGLVDWLSASTLLVTGSTDTAGPSGLELVDVASETVTKFWDGLYDNLAIDPEEQQVGITFPTDSGTQMQFILKDYAGETRAQVVQAYYSTQFRGGAAHRFVAIRGVPAGDKYELAGIGSDGQADVIGPIQASQMPLFSIAPDHSWMLIQTGTGFSLYDAEDKLVQSFQFVFDSHAWRPDSQGIFYNRNNALYYLPFPSGEPVFVDRCAAPVCAFLLEDQAVWLP